MKFQHSTEIQVAGTILRATPSPIPSGASQIIIPGGDASLTISIQQYLVSWGGLTTGGIVAILTTLGDSNPLGVFQTAPAGSIVIPMFGETHNIGTYGLRTQNNSTGGNYTVSVWYSIVLP